jgi:aminoglycoside phosphotransferase (APT) family kinase protein
MDKPQITPDVVSCLLREQFPELAHLPVTRMQVDGWDNSSFRVGHDFTARLPSADGYAAAVPKEHQWLPVLAPRLPLPIPEPVGLGAPGCGYPRPWSVYRWLPGEPASTTTVDDLDALARDVARFLSCLHTVDSRGGPLAGAHSFGRGGPLALYDGDVRACLDSLPADLDREAVLELWRTALSTSFEGEPRWFHGDLAPSNLLVRDGRLAAVIDFGTCGTGDPACDLVLAWTFLDTQARDTFRRQLSADTGTWTRARAWALWKALLTLDDPDHDTTVRRYGWRYGAADVIRNVLDDGGGWIGHGRRTRCGAICPGR